jgi:polyvinyl alcohol dehydrogenase (cytochrome)
MLILRARRAASQRRCLSSIFVLRTAALVWVGLICAVAPQVAEGAQSWTSAGQSVANDRTQPAETRITPSNVGKLVPEWEFTTHGEVSATPTVYKGAVYFPDFGGYLNAVNAKTGALIWQRKISEYDGEAEAVSRVSPAIYKNDLILGDNFNGVHSGGAHIFAINRLTGALIWTKEVDSHEAAVDTSNPEIVGDKVIVGVASNEEADAASETYPCCTFRGSVVALNVKTGSLLWKTYTIPPNAGPCTKHEPAEGCGYSGGAVWGTPTIDPEANAVYVGTGNNYTAPDAANQCQKEAAEHETSDDDCTAPNDYFDSVLALNLETGAIKWGHKVEGWDAWNTACLYEKLGATWCPSIESPDFDFGGGGPNLLSVNGEKLVGEGQKSGVYWAFNAATGKIVWDTLVGPGTALGGIEWGTAYDGTRIYVPESDAFGYPYELENGEQDSGGSWAALNPGTGAIEWQVGTPGGAAALGPASEANGVVFVGSTASSADNMFALEASTGKQLWSFTAEGSVNAAPAIANGYVYWGSGYAHLGLPGWETSHTFYAFALPRH